MKKDSLFTKIIILFIVLFVCVAFTLTAAWLIGGMDKNIFDLSNLNLYNAVPVLILGGIISCFVVGIGVLFLSRNVLIKLKKFFIEEDGGDKK